MLKILDENAVNAAIENALTREISRDILQKIANAPEKWTGALLYFELRSQLAEALEKLDCSQKQYWLIWILLNDPELVVDMAEYHLELRGRKADLMVEHIVLDALGMRFELATEQDLAGVAQLKAELLDRIIPATWPEHSPK